MQRIRISNLTLTSSSSAIKFEASTISNLTNVGDIFDVVVADVRIVDSNRGIGILERSGQRNSSRGRVRDILIRNVESTTRFDSKPNFWGSGEPFVITVLPRNGDCCSGVQNITLLNVSAVAENSTLISSLGSAAGDHKPPRVSSVRLENVSITIKRTGNTSRPQRDYRPSPVPDVVPALVSGIVVENIDDITLVNSRVVFSPTSGAGKQPYWSMTCLNVSGASNVHLQGHLQCRNATSLLQ